MTDVVETSAPTYRKTFRFNSSASSIGGFVDTPVQTPVPHQASVCLPTAGGHACVEGGAFNHHNIVSCRLTSTSASGKRQDSQLGWTSQVTSIVEGLNLMQVITADRVVAQISVDHPEHGEKRYSFAGTHFEGLRVAGKDVNLTLNPELSANVSDIGWDDALRIGMQQATDLASNNNASKWAQDSMEWMLPANDPGAKGLLQCSLVEQVGGVSAGKSFAHYLDIPGIGRIFLAELVFHPTSVQIVMMRAELGCHVNGEVGFGMAHSNGGCHPPC